MIYRKNKSVDWFIVITTLSKIVVNVFGNKNLLKEKANIETVLDLFFSEEFTLVMYSLNEEDKVTELEMLEGITLRKKEVRKSEWLSQEGQKICVDLKDKKKHLSITTVVLSVKEEKISVLIIKRQGKLYQSASITLAGGNPNINVEILPVTTKVVVDTSVVYKLNLKTTGEMTDYKNVLKGDY